MITSKKTLIDAQIDFSRGEETHKSPSRVPRNQLCLLVNGTTRQDYLSARPPFKKRALAFHTSDIANAFQFGLFQGAGVFNPDTGPSCIVVAISGRLWKIALDTWLITEITGYSGTNNPIARQVWFCQAENYLICQNGIDGAIIWNGATAWRSRRDGSLGEIDGHAILEVPTGTCMEYALGRLWVALPNGRSFVGGDLVYGPSGTEALKFRDSVLRFSENTFLAEGGEFAVPANAGPIRAMRAVASLDTSLGQGPLQVFTTQACFSVDAPYDRTLWKSVNYPIQTVSLISDGALSQNSTVQVNGDIWYRSTNGIRSFIIARRDFTQWGNRAMSHEVGKHIDKDTRNLLQYSSACTFDDRLLMTCSPMWSQSQGTYHNGLVALDFHPLTSINESEAPSWDGMWTAEGFDIFQLLKVESEGVQRCFALSLEWPGNDNYRRMGLRELMLDGAWDEDDAGNRTRITTVMESPRFDFAPSESNRLEQKKLDGCDIWVSDVRGTVDFYLYYRPDEYECWFPWKHWKVCAKIERCLDDAVNHCLTGLNLKPQYRNRMSALAPPSECIQFTNTYSNIGYGFQYRLEIVGHACVQAVRLAAIRIPEATFGSCLSTDAQCYELICCPEPERGKFPDRWHRKDPHTPGDSEDATNQVLTTEDNQAVQSESGDNFLPSG